MQIGIDIRMLGNRHGGIGRYVFELTKHILELETEHSYTLFYNENNVDPQDIAVLESFPNAKLTSTGARHYSFREQLRFVQMLNNAKLDLVHFPNFNVPLLYNKPFVVTIHDVVHHKISGAKKSSLIHFWAYKKTINHAAKNSKRIITVSEYSKKDIAAYLQVPLDKIDVTYEGHSLDVEVPEDRAKKLKKNFLLEKPYFLFVGVLERKKNIINLTRGFDIFMKEHGLDMDLVIAGKKDPHYPDIKYHALDIKFKNKVVFTDYVTDEELSALYNGAYAFVNASLHEGFGLPGVEAMQFGLPLVVSNSEVFNEIYENAAIYFDPESPEDIAEKMYLLARDEQFYKQIREKSLARGKIFSWKKAAEETVAIYNKIIG